jgi:hypothetical protein
LKIRSPANSEQVSDLGFENMDFGFFDWGTSQSWL